MDTLIKMLEKTPEMAALIILVYLFLKAQSESRAEFLTTIKGIQQENSEARRQSREVIKENTTVSMETNKLLGELLGEVKELDRKGKI